MSPYIGGTTLEAHCGKTRTVFEVIGAVVGGRMPDVAVNGVTRLRTPEFQNI